LSTAAVTVDLLTKRSHLMPGGRTRCCECESGDLARCETSIGSCSIPLENQSGELQELAFELAPGGGQLRVQLRVEGPALRASELEANESRGAAKPAPPVPDYYDGEDVPGKSPAIAEPEPEADDAPSEPEPPKLELGMQAFGGLMVAGFEPGGEPAAVSALPPLDEWAEGGEWNEPAADGADFALAEEPLTAGELAALEPEEPAADEPIAEYEPETEPNAESEPPPSVPELVMEPKVDSSRRSRTSSARTEQGTEPKVDSSRRSRTSSARTEPIAESEPEPVVEAKVDSSRHSRTSSARTEQVTPLAVRKAASRGTLGPAIREPLESRPSTARIRLSMSRRVSLSSQATPTRPTRSLPTFEPRGEPAPISPRLKRRAMRQRPLDRVGERTLGDLKTELGRDKQSCCEAGALDQAGAVVRAIVHVGNERERSRRLAWTRDLTGSLDEDLAGVTQDLAAFDEETSQMIAEIAREQDERREALRSRGEAEVREVQALWRSDAHWRHCSRASTMLVAARRQLVGVVGRGDYEGAILLRAQIAQIEADERQRSLENYKRHAHEAIALAKSERAVAAARLEEEIAAENSTFAAERALERQPLEKVRAKLQTRKVGAGAVWERTKVRRLAHLYDFTPRAPPRRPDSGSLVARIDERGVETLMLTVPPSVLAQI
jgi:hypothetical protein